MPLDTFTCGTCEDSFTDLNEFVLHKQRNCASVSAELPSRPATNLSQGTEVIQLHMNESGEITGLTSEPVGEGGDNVHSGGATFAFLNDVNMSSLSRGSLGDTGQGEDSTTTTHLIILNNNGPGGSGDTGGSGITLLDGSTAGTEGLSGIRVISQAGGSLTTASSASPLVLKTEMSSRGMEQQNSNTGTDQEPDSVVSPPPKKRRVGRAKTGEGKNKVLEAVPPSIAKPRVPETNAEGKLVCPQCKRTFTKERHFNTHKCLASSSYVDITKKEIVKIDSGDEEEEVADIDAGAQEDEEDEFTAPIEIDLDVEREEEDDEKEMDRDESVEKDEGSSKKRRGRRRKRSSYKFDVDVHDQNSGARQMKVAAESLGNLPIFKNEEDKTDFESCIDVDLSQVDHMFRIHIIEQELNEMSGMVYNTPTMSSLSVYSCNECEKVFKSLSHIRLHCVTHTNLKPFKCNKCNYSTNSKGNLYTHMRKHTGQFYRCEQCDFKTVNKSHLVEHQMTHDNRRSQCLLCQKDYSTLKSLINHIRKYHTDKKGKEYLQTFLQGRGVRGTTVIHQCHVCNRKFKKRIDRDRHLFIHDIKDLPHVQQCELCDYWASRRVYLDKHYLKHRVIYCCAVCNQKFLSTTRLSEHLTATHSTEDDNGTAILDSLLEECVNRSLYLPEPLATTLEGSKYVNLPDELREKNQSNQSKDNGQQLKGSTEAEKLGNQEHADTPPLSQSSPGQQATPATESSNDFLSEYNKFISGTAEDTTSPAVGTGMEEGGTNISNNKDEREEEKAKDGVKNSDSGEWQGEESVADNEPELQVTVKDEGQDQNQDTEPKSELKDENPEANLAGASPMLMLQNPGSDSDMEGEEGETNDKENRTDNLESPLAAALREENCDGNASSDVDKETTESADKDQEGDNVADSEPLAKKNQEGNSAEKDKVGESDSAKSAASKEERIEVLIKRLGYRKMNMEIFNKMRETFGTEECEYCGRLFYSKVDYEPHIRTHTGDKPFACANCSFRATTKDQLKKHSEREHEKVAFQCKECDFLAPTRTRLWNHQLKHLGISGLSCPECPDKFDGMKQLRAHILNAHQDIDRETLEKLTGYRHKPVGKMGRRSFKCPHCPRIFIRANSELQKHIWIHEGIRPFACPICPYACRSKNNLQAHMLRHSAEKPFSCSECGKEYKSKTALRWHVRSHKTGKLFKCDKCPYEATQSSHLKRHMETHDVLKRFICKHCDFSANTLGYMKIHYAKHHKGKAFVHDETTDASSTSPDKRVFKCLSCGYLFGNLSDLKRHLKIRHHIHMQDIAGMEQMQISEVEVVQYEDGPTVAPATVTSQQIQPAAQTTTGELQVQMSSEESNMPLSAVNLIQQIIGMSQGESQVRVVSEDGEPLDITPETIIVQQDGQLLLTNESSGILPGSQYVIQYYNPGEVQSDATAVNDNNSNTEIQFVAPAAEDQASVGTSQTTSQPRQFVITSTGQFQLLTSSGHPQVLPSDGQTQIITSQDGDTSQLITIDGEGHLLSTESEGGQFVNSDLENYNSQLIISDPSDQSESLVIGEATGSDDQQQLTSIEIVEGEEG